MSRSALGVTAAFLALAVPHAAVAQSSGFGGEKDTLSGYRCVDRTCTVLRLPDRLEDVKCICLKLNPGETRLNRLRLKCSTMERGTWVACPATPRFGFSVD